MASSSTTSTTVGTNLKDPPGPTSADGFVPRRSNRVSADLAQPDGDTWTERLAVCEGQGGKLVIRGYYKNSRTAGRVWDEPPSGASNIQHATADMRKHADNQLNELQFTLDMIPPEENMDADASADSGDGEDDGGSGKSNKKGKKGGLFGRFRKKEKPKKKSDDSKDLNLQRAIARSMADQKGGPGSDEPVVYYDPDSPTNMADDEALEMAKALSISESTSRSGGGGGGGGSSHISSEEEMFQRALEASQRETSGVASYMSDHEALLYQSPMDPPMPHEAGATASSMNDSHPDFDQKMAAKPEATRPSELFDPYNNETSSQPASSSSMQGGATYASTADALDEPASPPRPKMEADGDGKRKPGRKIARRVLGGGKKAMEDEAGMV
jgi:hypothetical protein